MDHMIVIDDRADEFVDLLNGNKSMIIREASASTHSYNGRICDGDLIYFVSDGECDQAIAWAQASSVNYFEDLTREEYVDVIIRHQGKLQLSIAQLKNWVSKRCIVLIEISGMEYLISLTMYQDAPTSNQQKVRSYEIVSSLKAT